jgi:hypothetical protein
MKILFPVLTLFLSCQSSWRDIELGHANAIGVTQCHIGPPAHHAKLSLYLGEGLLVTPECLA